MTTKKTKLEYITNLNYSIPVLQEDGIDLYIDNPLLDDNEMAILNVLESIIYGLKKKHLFGDKELKPIVNYNPNKMNKKQYKKTIKKAYELLGIKYVENKGEQYY